MNDRTCDKAVRLGLVLLVAKLWRTNTYSILIIQFAKILIFQQKSGPAKGSPTNTFLLEKDKENNGYLEHYFKYCFAKSENYNFTTTSRSKSILYEDMKKKKKTGNVCMSFPNTSTKDNFFLANVISFFLILYRRADNLLISLKHIEMKQLKSQSICFTPSQDVKKHFNVL